MDLKRWRWRMRGAWLWPAFVALTVADAVVLSELPFYDAAPDDMYGALLVAGVMNLFAVAIVAPLVGRAIRRHRSDLPREVAHNYAGTGLVCAIAVALVAGGLLHLPAVREDERDLLSAFAAAREYVVSQEPEYRDGLRATDALRITDDVYRTCIPGDDPRRPLCLVVNTDQHPAGVRRDSDRTPNAEFRVHGGFE